ncbi:hypothetical protein, partial [Cellulomonas algicola]|uniref:hypothetical protein n=1 Tax=Cellulomonas algicola TaxID=2071633 RepID=UPI001B3564D6
MGPARQDGPGARAGGGMRDQGARPPATPPTGTPVGVPPAAVARRRTLAARMRRAAHALTE